MCLHQGLERRDFQKVFRICDSDVRTLGQFPVVAAHKPVSLHQLLPESLGYHTLSICRVGMRYYTPSIKSIPISPPSSCYLSHGKVFQLYQLCQEEK